MHIFNRLAGYTESKMKKSKIPPVTLARRHYPRPSNEELVSSLSSPHSIGFLVARNPYERLISAYRDKIRGAYRRSYHDQMSKRIVVKYRKISPNKYKHGKTIPTFKEFVSFVIDEFRSGNELDMHWAPAYSFCNPCQVNLTHIIKFETFDRDTSEILSEAKLKHLLPPSGRLQNKNKSKGGNLNTANITEKYLKELNPKLLSGLLELYGIDFDMFGYDRKRNLLFRPIG